MPIIDFNDSEYDRTADFLVRWYKTDDTSKVLEQSVTKPNITVVPSTSPQLYRMDVGLQVPQGYPAGTLFYVTLLGRNAAGNGAESTPSNTQPVGPPAAPTGVTLTT